MKKTITIFALISNILILSSCLKKEVAPNKIIEAASEVATSKSARPLALSSELINLDTTAISQAQQLNDSQMVLAKAALYRFYKHVKVVNGFYTTDLKNGKEINISSSLFTMLKNSLTKTNSDIKKFKASDTKYTTFKVDDKYLNSLIK